MDPQVQAGKKDKAKIYDPREHDTYQNKALW
jgi:hypothetical protein